MLELLRILTKSDEERSQELLAAYLDDSLSSKDRKRFEQMMEADEELRNELQKQLVIKDAVSNLPRIRAPRSFVLDPAKFGRPATQISYQLYPALRATTVFAMFVFIALVSIDVFVSESDRSSGVESTGMLALAPEMAAEEASEGELAQDAGQYARAVTSEELPAEAPVMEEAVEEVVELEAAEVSPNVAPNVAPESEAAAPLLQPTPTMMAREGASAAEEPAAGGDGDSESAAPAEEESGAFAGAVADAAANSIKATLASALQSAQALAATKETDDLAAGDNLGAAEEEALAEEATPPSIITDLTEPAIAEITRQFEEAIPYSELAPVSPNDESLAEKADAEEAPLEAREQDVEGSLLGLGYLHFAEILLGLSVLALIVITLVFRSRVRRI
jgi:hypothetical protein